MSEKDREPQSEEEAERRLKEYIAKKRKEFPVPPVLEDEPLGLLNGNPDHFLNINEEDEDLSPEEIRNRFKIYRNSNEKKHN